MKVNEGSKVVPPTYSQYAIYSGYTPEGVYQYIRDEELFLICVKDAEKITKVLCYYRKENSLEPLVNCDSYEWNYHEDVFKLTDLSVNLEVV